MPSLGPQCSKQRACELRGSRERIMLPKTWRIRSSITHWAAIWGAPLEREHYLWAHNIKTGLRSEPEILARIFSPRWHEKKNLVQKGKSLLKNLPCSLTPSFPFLAHIYVCGKNERAWEKRKITQAKKISCTAISARFLKVGKVEKDGRERSCLPILLRIASAPPVICTA